MQGGVLFNLHVTRTAINCLAQQAATTMQSRQQRKMLPMHSCRKKKKRQKATCMKCLVVVEKVRWG